MQSLGVICRCFSPFPFRSSDFVLSFYVPLRGKTISLSAVLPLSISMTRWSRFKIPSPLFSVSVPSPSLFFFRNIRVKKESPSFQAPRRRRSPPPRSFGKKAIKGSRGVLRAPESVHGHFIALDLLEHLLEVHCSGFLT